MGEIRDAIDTLVDLKAEFAEAGIYSTKRSISASAMEGTANFPVLVDDSMTLDDSVLISRAAEKKFASFLLTTLTMDPFLEVSKGETPTASAYLKQFHQNMRVKDPNRGLHLSLGDFIKESTDVEYTTMESEALKFAYAIYEGVQNSIPQGINVRCNYSVEEVTKPDALNGRFRTAFPMMETKQGRKGKNPGNNPSTSDGSWDYTLNVNQGYEGDIGFAGDAYVTDRRTVNHYKHDIHNDVKPNINNNIKMPEQKSVRPVDRVANNPLTNVELKKANDLVPTLLHIRVYPIEKITREELTPIDFIMGVKATLHPLPVEEIARMVVSGMRNEDMVFNFIRWTTGEIKFFKDFLFAIDSIKMDAKDAGNDVTGWRPALKRRKNSSKLKVRLSRNSVLPNSTLVISQPTVDYISETYGYNLNEERIIKKMMDTYFLLAYVSVNPVAQRASFWFDGIDSTDTYTFDSLRRESQNDDKAFKNMMKMLGRSM